MRMLIAAVPDHWSRRRRSGCPEWKPPVGRGHISQRAGKPEYSHDGPTGDAAWDRPGHGAADRGLPPAEWRIQEDRRPDECPRRGRSELPEVEGVGDRHATPNRSGCLARHSSECSGPWGPSALTVSRLPTTDPLSWTSCSSYRSSPSCRPSCCHSLSRPSTGFGPEPQHAISPRAWPRRVPKPSCGRRTLRCVSRRDPRASASQCL